MAGEGDTSNDRGWMYSGWKRGKSTDEWYENTKEFLDFAFSAQANVVQNGKIKCPCADCRNYITKDRDAVELDLCGFGFKRNYNVWTEHGEGHVHLTDHVGAYMDDNDRMDDMVTDLAASNPLVGEEPIESAKAFYRMLDSVKELVHENTSHSTMSAIARLLTIKSMNNQSESAYNDTLQLIHELLPSNSSLPTNFYRSKKLLEGLGMPYHKIHVCRNNCMLYYKDNEAKLKCDICKAPRYKEGSKKVAHKVLRYMPITDRLQRLYAHEETAKMMRYHKKTPHPDDDDDMMVHPCDGEAWQQLDKDEPSFASDPRSVRLVMATDGFTPYSLTGVEVHAQAKMRVVDGLYGKEHNWNHVSCFWELPYFEKLLLRHTIDVMHNEKNVSESIWSTCFDIPDRTKDNVKARQDLEFICNRTKLHLKPMPNGKWEKPRAPFCIEGKHKVIILNWFKSLRFPDGYAASFRRGVNMKDKKIFGLKSHDYHIFIERLLPAAFRGFLPGDIWVCLSELSFFYRQLCAKQLSKATVANLEKNIVVLICKLEKIFPPGFFNPMQHLMIHLPCQARLAGPVQNIWMYRYESQYDTKHWTGRSKPTENQKLELRLLGSKVVNKECPDFFSWFRTIEVPTGRISHRRRRQVSQEVSQENNNVNASNNSENGTVIKKKKGRTSTRLKRPPNGVLIPIEAESDKFFKGDKGIAGQVTAILKYEYPSIIKEIKDGVEIRHHAFEWEDYCIVDPPDEQTGEIKESAVDQFKHEFWSIYTLVDDTPTKRAEADRVLQNLARKQLKQMMYQARKDAVKKYCYEIDEPINDSDACHKLLTRSQYVQGRLEWCKDDEAWESLCTYWCSEKYFTSRGLGKLSRTSSLDDDVAQNRGGSRNFISTKEYIAKTFGPEQATTMNTYKCMKVGAKKYKENGSNTSIENLKAKKRLDDYEKGLKSAYPEDWQERDLDPAVLYSTGGGMPHGRLLIGDGAFRKSQVVDAAKRSNIKPANSMSYQDLLRKNTYLEKKNKIYSKHMRFFYTNAGLPVPEDLEDYSMEDSAHVNQSSPLIENGSTALMASSRAGEQSGTPPSGQNHTNRAREDSPILDE